MSVRINVGCLCIPRYVHSRVAKSPNYGHHTLINGLSQTPDMAQKTSKKARYTWVEHFESPPQVAFCCQGHREHTYARIWKVRACVHVLRAQQSTGTCTVFSSLVPRPFLKKWPGNEAKCSAKAVVFEGRGNAFVMLFWSLVAASIKVLKKLPLTARSTTSESAGAFLRPNSAMLTMNIQISSI